MRPMKLTMQAFGAYREKTVLDFGELGNRSFFLIHGPTGSGKTTILDAICFALYGETSGQLRTSKTVRSDFADAKQRTFVDLVFSIGEKVYRIERSPEQERAKLRGEGTMLEKPQATLWQLDGEEKKVLASSTRTATEKIEEMLGFECSQFRQVVLLPQGEFRKLLNANSADRQEIMKTLFRTRLYERIEEQLKQKASGVKKLFEAVEQERRIILEASGATSEAELADMIIELQAEERELATSAGEKKAICLEKEAELAKGQQTEALFVEAQASQEAYQQAKKVQEEAETVRREWQTAMQAQKLATADAYLTQEEKSYEQKKLSLELAIRSHSTARQTLTEQTAVYEQEKLREQEREQAREERSRLDKLTEDAMCLLAAEKDWRAAQKAEETARKKWQEEKTKCQKYEDALAELNKQREAKLQMAKELASLSTDNERLARLYQTSVERDNVSREIMAEEEKLKKLTAKVLELDRCRQEAENQHHDVEMRWQQAQAGILAQTLAEGSPCPVCGSLHHPTLAIAGQAPSEEERKTAKRTADEMRTQHTNANLELATQKAHQDARLKKREELTTILGEATMTTQELGEQLAVATQKVKAASLAAEEAEKLKVRIQNGEKIFADTVKSRDESQELYQKAEGMVRSSRAIVEERKGKVPAELMAEGALEQAKKQADARIKMLAEAWQKAEQAYQTAQARLVKAEADEASARKSATEQEHKCRQLNEDLLVAGRELGFANREQIHVAMREAKWLAETETKLKAIDETALSARDRSVRGQKAILNRVRPDLAKLTEAKKTADTVYLEAVKEQQTKKDTIRQKKNHQERLVDCAKRTGSLEAGYRIVGKLAGIAGGDNEKKLTFQRYVLSELLTEVAEVASIRLLKMSRHRYTLQRTDERARKNAAGGLELEVFDNLTGLARPVGTLSGGEGFLASLALALGLADVVQSYAGGIRLDTMLIDEGFGTLDPEMLDFAISTLLELQKGGRLVGIISHVPELKERIDARLEVLQTNHGSTAVFHVG